MPARTHTARAFSRLAGVTAKTLRHYERRRLLAPRRNAAGYRLYSDRELRRVREIVALKALGLSLTAIRDLLHGGRVPLDVLRAQRETLESKRRAIDRAIGVIDSTWGSAPHPGSSPAGSPSPRSASSRARAPLLSKLISEAMWSHAEAQREKVAVARPPDRASESMRALAHDILRAADSGATPEQRDSLRAKWQTLVEAQSGGDPDVVAKMLRAWAKRHQWPRGMRDYIASVYEMTAEEFGRMADFIERALRARYPRSRSARTPTDSRTRAR